MDLRLSEQQIILRDMVQRLCADVAPLSELRKIEGQEPGYSMRFWDQASELGLPGLLVPEHYGGLGLGLLEAAVVCEEMGRLLVTSPYITSSVLAALLIDLTGNEQQKQSWLPRLAQGQIFFSVASLEPGGGFGQAGIQLRAVRRDGGYSLSGIKQLVPFARNAGAILTLARTSDDRILLLIVNPADPALKMDYQPNHAGKPLYDLAFDDLFVLDGDVLCAGKGAWDLWEGAMFSTLPALAAYAAGGARQVHELAVAYARERHAFGRPIGGFQAIAHDLAESIVEIEGVRKLSYHAAWAKDHGVPHQALGAMAKMQACDVFRRAAALSIQVHGGIGYTVEADPQLFFRNARHISALDWDANFLEDRIAALVLDNKAASA